MADQSGQSAGPADQRSKAEVKTARSVAKVAAKAERKAQRAEAKAEKEKVKKLAEMAQEKLLKELSASLDSNARSATFACGGNVPFKTASVRTEELKADDNSNDNDAATRGSIPAKEKPERSSNGLAAIDDIQVRFGKSGEGITVIFNSAGPSKRELDQLIAACQPASFGRAGEAVLDVEYRKAGKLDKTEFATSFCPYEAGIIDVITQLLVPQVKHEKHARSIRAELYKLNVYSAPHGKFKPHVDTPRDDTQIGSLVVALPSTHQGGELAVRHAKQEITFDWSSVKGETQAGVKWAAFYSDCEHEVYEVTAGHRVTLTYNLFITRGAGHLARAPPVLDPTQLPLFDILQGALNNPGFLRRGRVLAVWLTHAYAHTSKQLNFLPDALKGADMSLWNTAQALGLKCVVVPIMTLEDHYDGDTHVYEPKFRTFNGATAGNFELDECGPYWGFEMPESKITWLNDGSGEGGDEKEKSKGKGKKKGKSSFEEVQMAFLSYGNEPDIGIHYSRAAMLIRIPPFRERSTNATPPKSIWEGVKHDPSGCDDDEDWSEDNDYDEEDYDEDDFSPDEDEEMGEESEGDSTEDGEGVTTEVKKDDMSMKDV